MKFGKVDRFILLGGGELLAHLAVALHKEKRLAAVFSSLRHFSEIVPGSSEMLRLFLKQRGITCLESEDINQDPRALEFIGEHTLGIAFGAAWAFEKDFVDRFNGKLVDFMGIPLPAYRGGAHFTWQILRGDKSGACNMQLIKGGEETFHRGPILKTLAYKVPATGRIPLDYYAAMNKAAGPFLKAFVQDVLRDRDFGLKTLNEDQSTHFPFLSTETQGYIDWSWTTREIERFICAFDDPYPGSSTFLGNTRVHLKRASIDPREKLSHPFAAGLIVRKTADSIYVATRDGALRIQSVTDKSGSIVSQLQVGQRLTTPADVLKEAMQFHAAYDSKGLKRGETQ